MKILFFIDSLRSGGKERRLTELLKGLQLSSDIQFEIVVMSEQTHYREIFQLRTNIHHLIRKTKKDVSVFYKFYKICKTFRPDIVHCWDSMTAIYSVPACKLLNIKLINGMIVNAPSFKSVFNQGFLRGKLTFPFSNIVLANSKAGLLAYNAPQNKSLFIHNGFDFKRATSVKDANYIREQLDITTKYIVGMVASLSNSKDYATYFKAAQLLLNRRSDITFLAIGSETDSDSAKNLFDQVYSHHFRLLGTQSDVESFINAMDIGVLATFTEGISNSIMEYMALGKPVIATDGGGTSEILADKQTGFLVKRSSPEDLANKLELLLNDIRLAKEMGVKGQDIIEKEFSIDKMVRKYIRLYNDLEKNVPLLTTTIDFN